MNKILYLICTFVVVCSALSLTGCKDKEDDSLRQLILGRNEVNIPTNQTGLVKIVQGYSPYKATVDNENIATVSVDGANIYIRAKREGEAIVTITDNAGQESKISVGVTIEPIPIILSVSTDDFQIITGNSRSIYINQGNNDYEISSSNPNIVSATVKNEKITLTGVAPGTSQITVTDAGGESLSFEVTVKNIVDIKLSETELVVAKNTSKTISILYGNGTYAVTSADPSIAIAEVSSSNIIITGKTSGNTTISVTDAKGAQTNINVGVYIAQPAANLGSTYIQIPKFDTDPSVKALTNMSFETYVCIDKVGWLNTIMGVEGTFLIRQNQNKFDLDTADGSILSTTSFIPGRWYYVAATYDAANDKKAKLYINGVLEGEVDLISPSIDLSKTKALDPNFMHFYIGVAYESSRVLYGSMGETRVWSRTLTADEINTHNTSISVNPATATKLLAYWKLNDNTNLTTVNDLSGNGFDGTPSATIKNWTLLGYP